MICWLRLFVTVGLVSTWLGTCPAEAAQPAPNVVLFLVDDMGVMDTSVPFMTDDQGRPQRYPLNDFYRTPNMQRLAEQGIRFENFYAMSVCSPTRIAIMTGQNAARHGTTNWIHPDQNNRGAQGPPDWNWQGLQPGDTTLPGLLSAAGYRTLHVGNPITRISRAGPYLLEASRHKSPRSATCCPPFWNWSI